MSYACILYTENGLFAATDTRLTINGMEPIDDYIKMRHVPGSNTIVIVTGQSAHALSDGAKYVETESAIRKQEGVKSQYIAKFVCEEIHSYTDGSEHTYTVAATPIIENGQKGFIEDYVTLKNNKIVGKSTNICCAPYFRPMCPEWAFEETRNLRKQDLPTHHEQKWINDLFARLKYKSQYVEKDNIIGGNTDIIQITPEGEIVYLQWNHDEMPGM